MLSFISPKNLPLSKYECPISDYAFVPEEGLHLYLMSIVPPKKKFCIEFGARDGMKAHTRHLTGIFA